MDPVSQAVVGAAAAQVFLTDRLGKQAFARGAVGGLLPDLDVLIRSTSDPPLDVLTSYGTLWLWPFSRARLELDWMSIVDPLFTVPLLILTPMGRAWSKRGPALLAAPSRSPTSRSGGRSTIGLRPCRAGLRHPGGTGWSTAG